MARKSKKTVNEPDVLGSAAASSLDEDLLRVNIAAPSALLHQRSSKFRRRLVWIVVIACGLGSLATLNIIMNPPVQKVVASQVESMDVNSSLGKNAAYDSLTRWLKASPSPLPGGRVVSWDGFEEIKAGVAKSESDRPADAQELHTFTLAVSGEQSTSFYTGTVLVSVDKARGGVTAAVPSLLPRLPASTDGWSTQIWAGYETTSASDAVSESVGAWSKAFTGTPAELRLYVGDKNADHAYIPLSGARVLGAQVTNAAYAPKDGVKEQSPSLIIARVELTIAWGALTGGPDDNKGSRVQYDVLVEEANSASPRIVAWGAAGTGPQLKTYGNAVSGVRISENSDTPGSDKSTGTDEAQPSEGTGDAASPEQSTGTEDNTGSSPNHGEG